MIRPVLLVESLLGRQLLRQNLLGTVADAIVVGVLQRGVGVHGDRIGKTGDGHWPTSGLSAVMKMTHLFTIAEPIVVGVGKHRIGPCCDLLRVVQAIGVGICITLRRGDTLFLEVEFALVAQTIAVSVDGSVVQIEAAASDPVESIPVGVERLPEGRIPPQTDKRVQRRRENIDRHRGQRTLRGAIDVASVTDRNHRRNQEWVRNRPAFVRGKAVRRRQREIERAIQARPAERDRMRGVSGQAVGFRTLVEVRRLSRIHLGRRPRGCSGGWGAIETVGELRGVDAPLRV